MKDYIDKILDDLLDLNKAELFEEMLMRTKKFKGMKKEMEVGLHRQMTAVLGSGLLDNITARIGKLGKPIITDSDLQGIKDEIGRIFKGLEEYVDMDKTHKFLVWSTEIGGQRLLNELGVGKKFVLKNTAYLKTLENSRNLIIRSVNRTTRDWIAETIFKGKQEQLTNLELERAIMEKIPEVSKFRAETIVRTEMNNAVNKGEFETAMRNKATEKSWRTAGDDRVSEECQKNEAEGWIGIEGLFSNGVDSPPSHPNCRCDLRYKFPPVADLIWAGE